MLAKMAGIKQAKPGLIKAVFWQTFPWFREAGAARLAGIAHGFRLSSNFSSAFVIR